ncbi:unnamed protein product [Caenorhabditis sp. 36 PRJEB53466]|nr:unnamed protein product [Caenorhabditis sp. 36 PRJEB53466]
MDINPIGVLVGEGERHFQLGRLLHANLPVNWRFLVNSNLSTVRILIEWVVSAEEKIYEAANEEEQYNQMISNSGLGAYRVALGLDQTGERSPGLAATLPGLGDDITDARSLYWLSQFLCQMVAYTRDTSKPTASKLAILNVACGLMDFPNPPHTPPTKPWQHVFPLAARRNAYFSLMKYVVPCAVPDGKVYSSPDLFRFGQETEAEIFHRATSFEHYVRMIEDVRAKVIEYRDAEDTYLTNLGNGRLVIENDQEDHEEQYEQEQDQEHENKKMSEEAAETTEKASDGLSVNARNILEDFYQNPPYKDSIPEKRGKFMLCAHGAYSECEKAWNEQVCPKRRRTLVQDMVNAFLDTKKSVHPRLPELFWFAREFEEITFRQGPTMEFYNMSLENMILWLREKIQDTPELKLLRIKGDIPCTDELERLFTFPAPRHDFVDTTLDDEYRAPRGHSMVLITDEHFRKWHFHIKRDRELRTVEEEFNVAKDQKCELNNTIMTFSREPASPENDFLSGRNIDEMHNKSRQLASSSLKYRDSNPSPKPSPTAGTACRGCEIAFGPEFASRMNAKRGFGDYPKKTSYSHSGFGGSASLNRRMYRGADKDRSPSSGAHRFRRPSRSNTAGSSSASKRIRGTRRSGRRGRGGPGNCFHCGEHGHISKECPKKSPEPTADTPGGDGLEFCSAGSGEQPLTAPKVGKINESQCDNTYEARRLQNQKARESYYNAFNHGDRVPPRAPSVAVGRVSAAEKRAASPEIDKFSEQLEKALKLSSTPPSAFSSRPSSAIGNRGRVGGRRMLGELSDEQQHKIRANCPPARGASHGTSPPSVPLSSHSTSSSSTCSPPMLATVAASPSSATETLTIETRRTVMRDGEYHFEETTVIAFPRVLPPNVQVITAQFVPVVASSANK